MDSIRKSGSLIQNRAYVGQSLSLPMRGTTEDLCSGLCVSTQRCDAWEYMPDGTCNLVSLGDDVHALIRQGKERIASVTTTPKPGSVSGRIHYEHRGNILDTVVWILLGVLVVLGLLHLMKTK